MFEIQNQVSIRNDKK